MTLASLTPHWRTIAGAAIGAGGGALYAVLVGCHSGTCAITSSAWTSALFFGFTGAVVGMPGPRKDPPRERGPAPRRP